MVDFAIPPTTDMGALVRQHFVNGDFIIDHERPLDRAGLKACWTKGEGAIFWRVVHGPYYIVDLETDVHPTLKERFRAYTEELHPWIRT